VTTVGLEVAALAVRVGVGVGVVLAAADVVAAGVAALGLLAVAADSWLWPPQAAANSRLIPPRMTAIRFVALTPPISR
jgi:hypothetical protein